MKGMLLDARARGYAVCYCEAWNLESFEAELEAAEEVSAPAIVGFNGGSLTHPPRNRAENLTFYGGFLTAVRHSTVPVSFLLNETDNLEQIEQALDLGFNAIMVDEEHLDRPAYLAMVKKVVRLAAAVGASVEAQFGTLPSGVEGAHSLAHPTDVEGARRFVDETGIDALSVAVGNTHIQTQGTSTIDLDALARIHEAVDIPLVLHGGTGIPTQVARQVVACGVAKVNFGTGLKEAYLATLAQKLVAYQQPMNPHPFLGWGGPQDIMVAASDAVKAKVKDLLRAYGAAGKATQFCRDAVTAGE
jgi:ketose-bisphosphate aldolase